MATGILSSRSAPHFALQWSPSITVIAGVGENPREYNVPENVLYMHTTWFKENMKAKTATSPKKIKRRIWSNPAAFEIYLFWACNGALPDISSVPITDSEHFNVADDAPVKDPSTQARTIDHELAEWEAMMLQEQDPWTYPIEPPSILCDWLHAYMFGEMIKVDEFMDAVMRKMCQLVWDNKEHMKTITDDEAWEFYQNGDVRLRQFVVAAVFLNMETYLHHLDVSAWRGAYFKSTQWCEHFQSAYNRMWSRNSDETRIERWIRTRDQAKVQELFIKKKAPGTG